MCDVVLECYSCFQFWSVWCSHCERMSGSNVRESDKTGAGIIGDRPNHSPSTTQYAVKPKTGLQAREEQTPNKPRKVSRKNGLRGCPALAAVVNGKKGEAGSCWKSCCWIVVCRGVTGTEIRLADKASGPCGQRQLLQRPSSSPLLLLLLLLLLLARATASFLLEDRPGPAPTAPHSTTALWAATTRLLEVLQQHCSPNSQEWGIRSLGSNETISLFSRMSHPVQAS